MHGGCVSITFAYIILPIDYNLKLINPYSAGIFWEIDLKDYPMEIP